LPCFSIPVYRKNPHVLVLIVLISTALAIASCVVPQHLFVDFVTRKDTYPRMITYAQGFCIYTYGLIVEYMQQIANFMVIFVTFFQ